MSANPHRRFNPLRNEWIVVSPHRTDRPWQGQVEPAPSSAHVAHDPACYLCPGNVREGGVRNPDYASTYAFDNDFPALVSISPPAVEGDALFVAQPERGVCRVVCFSPRHDVTLARMAPSAIRTVVDTWVDEYTALAKRPSISYVTIFENRGAAMGASNPHPHCQIWATEHIPNEPAREIDALAAYRARTGTCLLCDYVVREIERGERVIATNDAFAAIVPFWAAWPFETLVVSRRHVSALSAMQAEERDGLADILKRLTIAYDNLFETPFPYSMGFHQEPVAGVSPGAAHVHAHFYPPLLRSATIRKFMVGFELLGSPQRDLTPEDAAARLKAVPAIHYLERERAVH